MQNFCKIPRLDYYVFSSLYFAFSCIILELVGNYMRIDS